MATMFPNGVPMPQPKPQAPAAPQPTPAASNIGQDLRSGWQEFLSHPENRAGLLQFGVSMLTADPGNTLGQNVGNAIGSGMAVRGAAQEQQVAQQSADVKERRAQEMHDATLGLRKAQTIKAGRAPQAKTQASGMPTQKDYAKEWVKYVKDARTNEDTRTVAELRKEFDEIWGAATTPPGAAPAAGGQALAGGAPDFANMSLADLTALDAKSLTPEQLAAASARYQALQKAK